MNTSLKYIISLLCLMLFMTISQELLAQSANPNKKAKQVDKVVKQNLVENEEVTYDTGETIGYLSSRMAYQLKKRLHLTDEEDDEEERKAKKKASKGKFSIFGIEIEKH